jgi:predicted Zn-dependent peptidase
MSRGALLGSVAALAVCAGAALSEPASPQESPGERLPVRDFTFDNGLRLLVLPRPGVPTVSFVMHFRVGGLNERLGTTGTAHLLEHMLFKGTESIGTRDVEVERRLFTLMDASNDSLLEARQAGDEERVSSLAERIAGLEDQAREYVIGNEFDRILTRAGAQGLNAQTTSESTIYHVELPANRAELFFALEADRMSNPVFREFYTERDVVMEERRLRVETSPGGLLYEAHLATAFTMHPYGVPVVGYMSDLQRLTRRDVERYYRSYYGPNNAVLAVVGSVDPDQIAAWARHYLGPIPRGEDPPLVLAVEPEQRGERRVVVEWDAQPRLRIGWHVPAATHPDAPALAILSSILTGGRTSRLHERLVLDDRLATSVFASVGPGALHPRLFQIEATPRYPHTTRQLESAIYEEIARLARDGPTDEEVERVHNQIAAGAIRRVQSNLGLAFQLAESEALLGDWRETFRSNAALARVVAADVRSVADRDLRRVNRTVATLTRVPAG